MLYFMYSTRGNALTNTYVLTLLLHIHNSNIICTNYITYVHVHLIHQDLSYQHHHKILILPRYFMDGSIKISIMYVRINMNLLICT